MDTEQGKPIERMRKSALKVRYKTESYGEEKEMILCYTHRVTFYAVYPDAHGSGQYLSPERCEMCNHKVAR